ncbi:MAG: hypothetical protein GZ091_02295 [Paludibacter sp.]|nr:hypothetical protein [Paludibacter sp.]
MERNASIKQILETMDRSIVKKHIHIPIGAYLLFIAGVSILDFTSHMWQTHKSILFSLLILLSIALILWGFLSGIVDKTYFKHLHSGTKIYFYEIFFDKKDFRQLKNIIDSGRFENLNNLQKSSKYNAKLEIAYSADKTFCMIQGVKYIPFKFAELTEAKQLDSLQTKELLHLIGNSLKTICQV